MKKGVLISGSVWSDVWARRCGQPVITGDLEDKGTEGLRDGVTEGRGTEGRAGGRRDGGTEGRGD